MIDAEHRAIVDMIQERTPPETSEQIEELAHMFDFLATYYRARGQTEPEGLASEQAEAFRNRTFPQT